jgi:hypothetical protein
MGVGRTSKEHPAPFPPHRLLAGETLLAEGLPSHV